ncbi:MAG: twin-arginine translocation signal domain-containing protein, partial [Planctomycetaceae bacterium]|nr:twin-arginine translocation signal domain-containing protein [Planctomycetaceae bacterium]
MANQTSRRDFIKQATVAGGGFGAPR